MRIFKESAKAMSEGYTILTSAISKWTELQQQSLSVAGSPVTRLSPFLAGRALKQGYVARTFDYNMMINYSNTQVG